MHESPPKTEHYAHGRGAAGVGAGDAAGCGCGCVRRGGMVSVDRNRKQSWSVGNDRGDMSRREWRERGIVREAAICVWRGCGSGLRLKNKKRRKKRFFKAVWCLEGHLSMSILFSGDFSMLHGIIIVHSIYTNHTASTSSTQLALALCPSSLPQRSFQNSLSPYPFTLISSSLTLA